MYKAYILNSDNERVSEVTNWSGFEAVLRFNDVGKWVFVLEKDTADLLVTGGGIAITRDGTEIISGPMTKKKKKWDSRKHSVRASGVTQEVYLESRLAYPVPGGPPYSGSEHDTRNGAAETVMKEYVDYNAGPNANSERQITSLTIETDAGSGSSIKGRARFYNLLTLLQSYAIQGGNLGFKISDLEFQVYSPNDYTDSIILSKQFGNIEKYEHTLKAPKANYIICGGGGVGTNRTFEEGGDPSSIVTWWRIERFRDRRDTTVTDELDSQIEEELEKFAEAQKVKVDVIDLPNMTLFSDYNLGDKVRAIIDGTKIDGIIREIRLKVNDRKEEKTLVLGTPKITGAEILSDMLRRQKTNNERLAQLEALQ